MHLTPEHLEIQRNLRRFIDNEINPHVDEWEEAEIFPAHELFKKMGGMGFTWDNPLSRAYRDGRLASIGAGADEVMLGIICKSMGILAKR